jgi:hypothetical protein
MISRRKFFSNAAVAAGAAALGAATRSAQGSEPVGQPPDNPEKIKGNAQSDQQDYPPGEPGKDYTPVITPRAVPGNTRALSVRMLKSVISIGLGRIVPTSILHSLNMKAKSRSAFGPVGLRG